MEAKPQVGEDDVTRPNNNKTAAVSEKNNQASPSSSQVMRVPIMPKFLRTPPKQRGDPDAWRPAEWKSVFWDLLRERRDEGEAHAPEWSRTWQEIPWEAARDQAMKALEAEERERKQLAGDALNRDDGDDAAAAATSVDEMGLSQREYWDLFYRFNQERFFKDRHYLGREFPLLEPGSAASESFESLVEAGCGAGNTLFPLVRAFPQKRFFALDLSEEALALLRRHPDYDPARITALRFDLAGESEVEEVLPGCAVDVALLVFCLSAIEPCRQADALARVARLVRPGGLVLLRDYGLYDMTQVRFISKGGRRLAENTYMRADGTRVCYFSLEALRELAARTGLECLELRYDTRELRNRKRKLSMYRVWVHAVFRRAGPNPVLYHPRVAAFVPLRGTSSSADADRHATVSTNQDVTASAPLPECEVPDAV